MAGVLLRFFGSRIGGVDGNFALKKWSVLWVRPRTWAGFTWERAHIISEIRTIPNELNIAQQIMLEHRVPSPSRSAGLETRATADLEIGAT
jgi:hypothetical protein